MSEDSPVESEWVPQVAKWKFLEPKLKGLRDRRERKVQEFSLVLEKSVVQLVVRLLQEVVLAPLDLGREAELEGKENQGLSPEHPTAYPRLKLHLGCRLRGSCNQ